MQQGHHEIQKKKNIKLASKSLPVDTLGRATSIPVQLASKKSTTLDLNSERVIKTIHPGHHALSALG